MTVVFPRKGIRHLVSGFGQWFLLLEVAESGAVNQLCAAEASPGGVAARQRWQPSTPMGFVANAEMQMRSWFFESMFQGASGNADRSHGVAT